MSAEDTAIQDDMPTARMTEAMIADMRARAGTDLRIESGINNEEATRTAIIRFVDGIGDDNPLWTDADYARDTFLKVPVAPPSWVLCCFAGIQFGWPGLGGFHSDSHFKFHRLVRQGDRIIPRMVYEGFDGPRQSSFAGKTVTDRFLQEYRNQDGALVCELRAGCIRYERGEGQKRAGGRKVELPHPWTAEELQAVEAEILAERPRGRAVRWWDEVAAGDPMEGIIKGPIGLTDEIAFVATGAAPVPRLAAHGVALRRYHKHPKWAFRDPETKALEPIYAVHYNKHAAQAMGVPTAYDVGVQRSCWQIHLVTHWMGDDAWLKEVACQYRGFVYLSDVVRFGGRVVEKLVDDDGDHVVQLETWGINQRGVNIMPGSAVVALSRKGSRHPLEGR
jgi:acyl dehydratase